MRMHLELSPEQAELLTNVLESSRHITRQQVADAKRRRGERHPEFVTAQERSTAIEGIFDQVSRKVHGTARHRPRSRQS